MTFVLVPAALLVPVLAGFLLGRLFFPRSRIAQVACAGVGGAATGAFFGSAASAMAPEADTTTALLRGGSAGFLMGMAAGAAFLFLGHLVRRARGRA